VRVEVHGHQRRGNGCDPPAPLPGAPTNSLQRIICMATAQKKIHASMLCAPVTGRDVAGQSRNWRTTMESHRASFGRERAVHPQGIL